MESCRQWEALTAGVLGVGPALGPALAMETAGTEQMSNSLEAVKPI